GDPIAILSQTRREWLYCDLAVLSAGGITVGVYPTLTADQSQYILAHSEARLCVVEDATQLGKVWAHRSALPRLEKVILIHDAPGVPEVEEARAARRLCTFDELRSAGGRVGHDVDQRVAAIRPEDAATFIYTSGTTGPPKGAMITHGNLVAALKAFAAVEITD